MKLWIKTLLMFGGILLLTAIAVGGYTMTVLNSTTTAFKMTYTNVGNKDTQKVIEATKPLTILLMGVDTGGAGRGDSNSWNGNSDSQILMTLNPQTHTTTMVSLERDTMTNILDAQGKVVSKQKMNAAYPMGYNTASNDTEGLKNAVSYAMTTIGEQTGVKIDNFMTVNFDGLINMVNDVGGIDVYNDPKNIIKDASNPEGNLFISDTEPAYTAVIKPGHQHLDGDQALVYTRDRHHRTNGDYGRAAAQREVIAALMKKLLSPEYATQYEKILKESSKDFRTNIPINASTITSLLGYKSCFDKVVSIQYEGIGQMVDGGSYQFMTSNIYLAIQNAMKKSLGESAVTELPSTLITYETQFGSSSFPNYFMPSATVTEKGKTPVIYGLDTEGNLVKINSGNSGTYVSTNGGAVQSDAPAESSTEKSSSSSSSATTDSSVSASQNMTTTPSGLTEVSPGVYSDVNGYYVYYKNGGYYYHDGTVYSG